MASHESSGKAEVPAGSVAEEEIEYESDSEGGTTALAFRRRAASDDEEDDQETNMDGRPSYYDEDVEDQGAPPPEDEEDEEQEEEEEEEEEDEEEYEDADEIVDDVASQRRDIAEDGGENVDSQDFPNHKRENSTDSLGKAPGGAENAAGASKERAEQEKKEAEPFVVPTTGAFYMHDDRFRYNGVARPRWNNARRGAGGRKLWEAKDEKPWVHDRFEELKLSEDNYHGQGGRGRRGRGRQGRGHGRGKDSGQGRGRGSKERVSEEAPQPPLRRGGRGRGLRRAKMDDYEFRETYSSSNRSAPPRETGPPASATTKPPHPPVQQATVKPQESTLKRPSTSSSLNSASPPFFPTGAITNNLTGVMPGTGNVAEERVYEKEAQPVSRLGNTSRTGMDKGMAGVSQANVGRPSPNSVNSTSGEVDNNLQRSLSRGSSNVQQQILKTGAGPVVHQQRPLRAEVNSQNAVEQPSQQASRETSQVQSMRVQPSHQQLQRITPAQMPQGQPMQQQSLVSSVPLSNQVVDMKVASAPPGNKLGAPAARPAAPATVQAGRGSFVYGSGTLTNGLRSVVQFAGQPQGGLGVPTVGVALPGYSSQPQFGFPSSEVTWIPILAGGPSLGSNYSSPYIAVDGNSSALFYAQQTSQSSTFPTSGREPNGSKPGATGSFKPTARPEPDELGQQRKRYSQMTFGEERR